jgi:hypothetical protein
MLLEDMLWSPCNWTTQAHHQFILIISLHSCVWRCYRSFTSMKCSCSLLLCDAISDSAHTALHEWLAANNELERTWKWPWPNWRHCTSTYSQDWVYTTKNLRKVVMTKVQTVHAQNTSQKHYSLSQCLPWHVH